MQTTRRAGHGAVERTACASVSASGDGPRQSEPTGEFMYQQRGPPGQRAGPHKKLTRLVTGRRMRAWPLQPRALTKRLSESCAPARVQGAGARALKAGISTTRRRYQLETDSAATGAVAPAAEPTRRAPEIKPLRQSRTTANLSSAWDGTIVPKFVLHLKFLSPVAAIGQAQVLWSEHWPEISPPVCQLSWSPCSGAPLKERPLLPGHVADPFGVRGLATLQLRSQSSSPSVVLVNAAQ